MTAQTSVDNILGSEFLTKMGNLSKVATAEPQTGTFQKRHASLKSQLRRAAQAVPLLIAESRSARGARNPDGFSRALGEAREVKAALQVAAVMGYVEASDDVYDLADHLCAMLYKLSRG